ncbi:2,3-bisphosphoglycerate-independent phosphoglycerate mutase [Candidatus Dojkabacteria bacterium]|nr:2,3-bisphosphoglycerate-independent phosphoglycerate mutase [Candidatus Dojkabacteria bacterium]
MKPFALIILDGLGVARASNGNAVALAKTPFLEKLWNNYPHGYLNAAEEAVGLPAGINGNSEVGHLNIGAGKVVYQSLLRIDRSIESGHLLNNQTLKALVSKLALTGGRIHLAGILSDGGVHSHINHLLEILSVLSKLSPKSRIFIHCFTDGRDSGPKSAATYFEKLSSRIQISGVGEIATILGRYYLDRDEKWDRTKVAYDLFTQGIGKRIDSYSLALNDSYEQNKTDEFLNPYVLNPDGIVKEGDAFIFLNFRADRATQLTEAFVMPDFTGFPREIVLKDLFFSTMMLYSRKFIDYTQLIFPRNDITVPLGRILSQKGITQLRIAESEKFPHVTYFFNGGQNIVFDGEDRVEVPSPRDVATYDQKPQMSADEVTRILGSKIETERYGFYVVNFANPDMVAHTGNLPASIKAVEVVDECMSRIVPQIVGRGGRVIVTADHGNAEELITSTGDIDTEHSINPVPFCIVGNGLSSRTLPMGRLCDIAPTVLSLLGFDVPSDMTGRVLYNP